MAAARTVLTGGGAQMLLSALARRPDRSDRSWALLALPATLGIEELRVVAAGVLAALGRPFSSIRQGGGRMWIGEETTAVKEAASFASTPFAAKGCNGYAESRTLAASAGRGRRPHPRSEHDLVRMSLNLLGQQCGQVRRQLQEHITRARDT
ncbi:hypothetical protein OG298_00180 [Streptomyces sp. NBC_01005]|uniref:hypothetical protein n=1 Tax=unclassified Streptomyces TaxID=2593676 RepID=UPI002E34408A|nr:hypothetical protein [Streptomyces sp. NBC_01362]WSW02923.1 hypothetical protein OG298_00180 [Streptomyces sp. NBC_01005]WTC92429.1 hypothetical protein OH736_00175 [Streptomyces sp. NBC_01650]